MNRLIQWGPLFDLSAQYRWDDGPWGGGMMHYGMGWVGAIFMVVFWVLIIAALVIFIRWLVSADRSGRRYREESESALDILKKRYAKGEINKQEFEDKKKDLT